MKTVYLTLDSTNLKCTTSTQDPNCHHVGSCNLSGIKICLEYGQRFQAQDFWKGKRMFQTLSPPFRHHVQLEPDVVTSLSLLKSALQKCVRRGETDLALSIAKTFMYVNFKSFVRRLFLIAAEDVLLDENSLTLVWMLQACDLGYKPSKNHLEWLLAYVRRLCEEQSCIVFGQDERTLSSSDQPLQIGIRLYLSITKLMKGDILLLTWYHNHPEVFAKAWELNTIVSYDVVGYVTKATYPLYGIDYHTTPYMLYSLHQMFPDLSEDDIKTMIWRCRSSINFRKKSVAGDVDIENYKRISTHLEDFCARVLQKSVRTRL